MPVVDEIRDQVKGKVLTFLREARENFDADKTLQARFGVSSESPAAAREAAQTKYAHAALKNETDRRGSPLAGASAGIDGRAEAAISAVLADTTRQS